jgi:hypothetical protein
MILAILYSVIWSTLGLYLTAIILGGLAVASFIAMPRWIPLKWQAIVQIGLVAAFCLHLAGGYFYRSGVDACEARVAAAVKKQAQLAEKLLGKMRSRLDELEAVNAKADDELADLNTKYAAMADRSRCRNTKGDADAINGRH